MSAHVELRGVTKTYGRGAVITDVSLIVDDGERVVVVGPSGSGKTTLLRLIAGLETPDDGEIWIGGRRVAVRHRNLVAAHQRGVGYVFQDLALWPHMTVAESLEFVLAAGRIRSTAPAAIVREALNVARADGFADRYPHQLSGGEQQRAALARAVVAKPRLLLLDEPFSNLDAALKRELRRDLDRLQRTLAMAFVAVSHDSDDAEQLGDRVVVLERNTLTPLQ